MKSMIEFKKLGIDEKMFCRKMLQRHAGMSPRESVVAGEKLRIATVVQRPWTCVFIKNGKKQGVGFSKQCRYAPDSDEWSEDIGKNIALSRAIRDMLGK